jgi:hypothetical protein
MKKIMKKIIAVVKIFSLSTRGMPRNLFRVWSVPRSLIAQRVKIPFFQKESLTKETGFL